MTEDDLLKGAEEEGYGWEEAPDLTSISEEELGVRLKELVEEERAERGGGALPPEELARVLLDGDLDNSAGRSV